jgi:hypothetical protein
MPVVTRLRTAFTTSGGDVATGKLRSEIEEDVTITSTIQMVLPSIDDIEFHFENTLSGGEESALDTLVTDHDGVEIPVSLPFSTSHVTINPPAGTNVVDFQGESHAAIGSMDESNERLAGGPGQLAMVVIETDDGATVTVQLVVNGSAVGSGKQLTLVAGTPAQFIVPVAEREYAKDDKVSVAFNGLTNTSVSNIEAFWSDNV